MVDAVAVVRGKGMKSVFHTSEPQESKSDFIMRVAEIYASKMNGWPDSDAPSNTLTIEYVFNIKD